MVLKSRVRAPDWSADGNPDREAKCRKHPLPKDNVCNADTDPWFFAEEESALVCNGTLDGRVCPFREVCLYGALENNETAGTFGGMTTRQRRWIRKQSKDRTVLDPDFRRDRWPESDDWRHKVPTHTELREMEGEDDDEESADPED